MSASISVLYPDNARFVNASVENPVRVSVGQDTLRYGLTATDLDSSIAAGQTVVFERAYWIKTDADAAVVLESFEPWDPDITDSSDSGTALRVMRESPNRLRYTARPVKSSGNSAMVAADNTLTVSATGSQFTGDDEGRDVMVEGAGTDGDNLVTTIASVTDATHAELTDAAITTVSGEQAYWGDDASSALQAALDAGGPVEIVDTYLIKNTVTLPDNVNINGANRTRGARGRLVFIGGATDNCLESEAVNQSGLYIGNLDIRDRREGATGGDGINLNAPKNSVNIERVWLWDWTNNGLTISAEAGFAPDVVSVRNVWSTGFGQYGIHLQRAANQVLFDHISGDTRDATQADGALIKLDTMATNGQCTVVIQAVKFESGAIAAHAIDIDAGGATVIVKGAILFAGTTGAGGAVVRRTSGTVVAEGLVTINADADGPGADCLFHDAAGAVKYGDGLRRMGLIVCPGSSATVAPTQFVDDVAVSGQVLTTGGLGVGNSAAASSLGTVTDKVEVFDAAGASLGFVPIYDAIT